MAISGRNKKSELNISPIPRPVTGPAAYAISVHTASCLHTQRKQTANYSIVPTKRHGQNPVPGSWICLTRLLLARTVTMAVTLGKGKAHTERGRALCHV